MSKFWILTHCWSHRPTSCAVGHFLQLCQPIWLNDLSWGQIESTRQRGSSEKRSDGASATCVCLLQSQSTARSHVRTAACAWASTRAAVPTDSAEASVKLASLPFVHASVAFPHRRRSSKAPCFFLICVHSGDHPLCAPMPTRRHLQPTQHLHVSRGHHWPALPETVSGSGVCVAFQTFGFGF